MSDNIKGIGIGEIGPKKYGQGCTVKVGRAVTKFNFQVDRGIREVAWVNRALFDKINIRSIVYSTSRYCSPSK